MGSTSVYHISAPYTSWFKYQLLHFLPKFLDHHIHAGDADQGRGPWRQAGPAPANAAAWREPEDRTPVGITPPLKKNCQKCLHAENAKFV